MHRKFTIKNHQQEIQIIAQRSLNGLIFILFLLLLLIIRLAYLQIHKNSLYTTMSTKNWLDLVPAEPTRGLIFDRNGILLAENVPVFSLDLIPYQVPHLEKTLTQLKKIIDLSQNEIQQLQKQLKQHRRFDEIPLKLRLTEAEVAKFTENQHRFKGVFIKARLMRHYPYGTAFSHVMGYVGRINQQELSEIDQANYSGSYYIGKLGIEKFYEEELHGTVGYEQVENDASGQPLRVLKKIKGIPGKNIYLTIDSHLQKVAEAALAPYTGALVAIEPKTGQILAMVSNPAFDPNLFVLGISHKDYETLSQSEDRPLYHRATRGLYPLASTIKPYLALGALNDEVITPETTISDPGWFQLPNYSRPYRDWVHGGHGIVNLHRAIMSSCDVFFYDLAVKMGINRMDEILTAFGFGSPTGIDLEDEVNGIVASPQWKKQVKSISWYPGDTVMSGIGQGYMQATPLQLAVGVATIANRGQRFIPYLMLGSQTPGEAYVKQTPTSLEPVKLNNEAYWQTVIEAMEDVVEGSQGTARRYGQDLPYTIAAKTGTAQVISKRSNLNEVDKQLDVPKRLRDHHLFVAFAPVNKPKIAIAVITENSNNAIEVAKSVIDNYLGNTTYAVKTDTP